jgi:hypothetical protein
MATNLTLTEAISRVRQRSDMEHGTFVSDDEIIHMLNDEIHSMYGKMCNVDSGSLFATVTTSLVALGNNAFQLPSDFLRLIDVNINTGSRWTPAYEADEQQYMQLLTRTYSGDYDVRYYLHLNQTAGRYELFLFPSKDVANIGCRYIPEAPSLSVGTDTLKWPSNWHEPLIAGAAAKCLIKEESDPTALLMAADEGTARVLKDIRSQQPAQIETLRSIAGRNRRRRGGNLPWG